MSDAVSPEPPMPKVADDRLPTMADLDGLERSLDEIDRVLAELELTAPAPPTLSRSESPSPAR